MTHRINDVISVKGNMLDTTITIIINIFLEKMDQVVNNLSILLANKKFSFFDILKIN